MNLVEAIKSGRDFKRRKWSNVKKLLQTKSNQKISGFFEK